MSEVEARKPPPARAIAAKKAQADANRKRIAEAILTLQKSGADINVQSVARAADVHPDTVRRSGELFAEVKRLRDLGPPSTRPVQPAPQPTEQHAALRARILDAQAEVVALRAEVSRAKKAAHQALGTSGSVIDPEMADQLRRENAELTVAIMNLQTQVKSLVQERESLSGELLAARELNREYARDLNAARDQVITTERELTRLRALASPS